MMALRAQRTFIPSLRPTPAAHREQQRAPEYGVHPQRHHSQAEYEMKSFQDIKPGDRVTILVQNGIGRNGQEWRESSGRVIMRGEYGWVLNMGGRHGTPGVCTKSNFVRFGKKRT